jgi:hypothetical protein
VKEGEGAPWLVTAASVNVTVEPGTPELLEGSKLLCVVVGEGAGWTMKAPGPAMRVYCDSALLNVM